MKTLDRLTLIDRIGRELQSRMGYADIDIYLKAYGIDVSKPTSGVNSKWVYSKELLSNASDDTIIKIADELDIPHTYTVTTTKETIEATFWEPSYFRLFLSHISSYKKNVAALQMALRRYGIYAFVAHVDIEPTKEWQDEIEAGLYSMDALVAILMPGFKESDWTNQEVGAALGRGVLVIPVNHGLNPYGFIGKFQGLDSKNKTVSQVAQGIFNILVSSNKTRALMLTALVDTILKSTAKEDAIDKLTILDSLSDVSPAYYERLRDGASSSAVFNGGFAMSKLNSILTSKGLTKIFDSESDPIKLEDIPF